MLDAILSIMVLIGATFTLLGSLALVKFPDFYMRLHGPTKATTLGVGAILVASMLYFTVKQDELSLHEVLVTLFLFITAPISANLLSKAAIHLHNKTYPATQQVPYQQADKKD